MNPMARKLLGDMAAAPRPNPKVRLRPRRARQGALRRPFSAEGSTAGKAARAVMATVDFTREVYTAYTFWSLPLVTGPALRYELWGVVMDQGRHGVYSAGVAAEDRQGR